MMRDESQMSVLAAETERWFWHSQYYSQCECCGLFGHVDDEFTEDASREVCNTCVGEMVTAEERKAEGQ